MAGSIKQNSNFIDELKSFIEEYKLENYVKFPGPCLNMPAAYKLCDIVVSPADKPEGFGRIIIEAHAMNRPVIASAHGGSLELIKDNYNGYLFTPTDEFDLANKIKHLLSLSKGEKKRITKTANILVKEHYNIYKMCDLNFKMYNSLIV